MRINLVDSLSSQDIPEILKGTCLSCHGEPIMNKKNTKPRTNLLQATAAEREYSEREILSSTMSSTQSSDPWAMAPMKKTIGPSFGRVGRYCESLTVEASPERVILRAFGGRWSVRGFLMTLMSLSGPFTARMESLCKSWTVISRQFNYPGNDHPRLSKQPTHESGKSLKSPWNSDMRIQLNQDILCCAEIDLEETGLVQGRVEEGEETLVSNIRARLGNFPPMFS